MEQLFEMSTVAITAVGLLAFATSVIVETIKKLPGVSKVPTDIVVMLISMLLTVCAMCMYTSTNDMPITWQYAAAAFVGSFFVSFVTMYGWEKLTTMYKRFSK